MWIRDGPKIFCSYGHKLPPVMQRIHQVVILWKKEKIR